MGVLQPLPVTVMAKYEFTRDEKQQLGSELAAKIDRLNGLQVEKKSLVSELKERIDNAASEVSRLSSNINLGYEYRSYTCRIEKNYKLKIKEYYCVHTDKLIDTKKFDPQDFQQTFEEAPTAKKSNKIPSKAVEYRDNKYFDKNGKEIKVKPVEEGEPKPTLTKPLIIKIKKGRKAKL